jgi:hypothetical protein
MNSIMSPRTARGDAGQVEPLLVEPRVGHVHPLAVDPLARGRGARRLAAERNSSLT